MGAEGWVRSMAAEGWVGPSSVIGTPVTSSGAANIPPGAPSTNAPFDKRMLYSTSPWTAQLMRGFAQAFDPASNKPLPNFLWFLFNPNQITVSYSLDPLKRNTVNDSVADAAGGVDINSTIAYGVSLMFDRSYEVRGGDPSGVHRDVRAAEAICRTSLLRPWLTRAPIRWVFGTDLVLYGWVSSMNVNYLHFSENMIPMRCSIEFQIQFQPTRSPDFTENLALGGVPGATTGSATTSATTKSKPKPTSRARKRTWGKGW